MAVTVDTTIRTPRFIKGSDLKKQWGLERTVEAILIHHWGIDGQKQPNVVRWFTTDPENMGSSCHEVIGGNLASQICKWEDVAWHAGSRKWNAKTIGLELRPEADDETLATAASRIRAIRDVYGEIPLVPHQQVKNTSCPGRYMNLLYKLDEMATELKEDKPVAPHAVSPFEGRFTQRYGTDGGYKGHAGIDIAPPQPGQTGQPVRAMYDSTVRSLVRNAQPGNKKSTWAPGRTGNGMKLSTADGMGQGYNHVKPVSGLEVGDKVKAGETIGYNDRSGNQTAPHLHFETWADWRDHTSHYNPMLDFNKFDIRVGSGVALVGGGGGTSASKPSGGGSSSSSIQSWSNQPNGSSKFPSSFADLLADGKAGALTYGAHQIEMYQAGFRTNHLWDGKFEKLTITDTQLFLRSQGYYQVTKVKHGPVREGLALSVDGGAGFYFWYEFQRFLKARGFYKGALDGSALSMTIEAWQKWLNSRN